MYCESFGNVLNSERSAVFGIITVHGDSARVARESLRVSPCSQCGDGWWLGWWTLSFYKTSCFMCSCRLTPSQSLLFKVRIPVSLVTSCVDGHVT